MPPRIIRRGLAATLGACILLLGPHAPALGRQEAPAQPAPVDALDPAPPEPAVAMDFYRAVDSWVRNWQLPMDPSGQRRLSAAAVTLRLDGTVVGRGVAVSPDPAGGSGILMMATKWAMDEAKARLPVKRDALQEESLRAAAGLLTIGVEIAGRPVPIDPVEAADLVTLVAPGLDGVAVRMGDRFEAFFPERMLTTGLEAHLAAASLVSKSSGDPTMGLEKPGDLREKHGVVYYRFAVSHLAQTEVGGTPVFLHRGGRVANLTELTSPALRVWAEQLAQHLWYQRWPGKEGYGIQGAYDPIKGTNEYRFADPAEQAVVALAMQRYGRLTTSGLGLAPNWDARTSVQEWLTGLLHDIATVDPGEAEPWHDPAAAAMLWAVLDDMRVEPMLPQAISGPTVTDPTLVDLKKHCRETLDLCTKEPGSLSPPIGAVVAWSLRQSLRTSEDDRELIKGYVSAEFTRVNPASVVATLPWLGWADLTPHSVGDPAAPLQAAAAWRSMRTQLWQHQLKPEDLPAESRDLAGGIIFTSSRQPLPTWHSARPLAFIATMVGQPSLTTNQEFPAELVRLLTSLRFLRQLTATEAEAHMYKDPPRAIGGVRASLFDQRMPPEATAMTLLTVCETLQSLEAIRLRQGAPSQDK